MRNNVTQYFEIHSRSALILLAASSLVGCNQKQTSSPPDTSKPETTSSTPPKVDIDKLPVVEAELLPPPKVAPPVNRTSPAKVVVHLEVVEKEMEIADGATYTFWTFGGSVPGPMIRVRRGDAVELHLMNHPDNTMPHNIDLHAVTGPGGGATSSFTAPGHKTQFTFQALNEGVYIYHCATAPVGMHIANGMYGLIVVEPEGGYPKVDREYYVVQGDFYTKGDFRASGHQDFVMERAIDEDAAYVLFNGRDGALVGDNALTAKTGETVRLFVGNGGPNLVSSFHVIGEIFDRVYAEGGSNPNTNVQTTLVPAGGAAVVEFKLDVPGTFILVDHSIFRAFNKGALGMLKVTGDDVKSIYSGLEVDEVYLAENSPAASALLGEDAKGDSKEARMKRGAAVFLGTCSTCHMKNGEGLPKVFPPLAKSDYLVADVDRAIRGVLQGISGTIVVNGEQFSGVMPAFSNLTDHEIADVLTYVNNSFGNKGEMVSAERVGEIRASLPKDQAVGHP